MDLRERPTTVTTRHPWETARARFFTRLLADHLSKTTPAEVLDVGAGDGFVAGTLLAELPTGSTITCVDPEYTDAHLASLRASAAPGLSFTRACPDRAFDVIVLLDVLEHVLDDRQFLRELVEHRLRAGGILVVSVPAHQALFTRHDVLLGHQRRYSSRELRRVIAEIDLRPQRCGSLFSSLIVPRALAKALELARGVVSRPGELGVADRVSTGVSEWEHGPVLTSAVRGALELDAWVCALAARYTLPNVGLSVWALCERAR